jgi:hypothetical protein
MKIYSKQDEVWLDYTNTMYPSTAAMYDASECINGNYDQGFTYTNEYSNIYGYVFSGDVLLPNGMNATAGQYFSCWSLGCREIRYSGKVAIITRIGFKGQDMVGGPLEDSGRLVYIDGCSDSLLVYPPRQGDPSLNALFFPPQVNQSYHIHPSIRLGMVISGKGYACLKEDKINEKEIPLTPGTLFCIEERELHRFRTDNESMVVVAFHPDGDWGPTDHNHTMLNRTYITK